MFLELSARYLMERHHAMENDPLLRIRAELRGNFVTAWCRSIRYRADSSRNISGASHLASITSISCP